MMSKSDGSVPRSSKTFPNSGLSARLVARATVVGTRLTAQLRRNREQFQVEAMLGSAQSFTRSPRRPRIPVAAQTNMAIPREPATATHGSCEYL